MRRNKIIRYALSYLILTLVLVVAVFPIVYTVTASFKTNREILTNPGSLIPAEPTLENFKLIFTSDTFNFLPMLFNSIYYTLANVAIMVVLSSMAGYVFSRGKFPGRNFLFACFSLLMFVKTGGIEIYPKFEILGLFHLTRGLPALLFLNMFAVPVANMYLVRGYVDALPKELDESAEMDGCTFISTFFRIVLPLIKPILATIAILTFQGSWNDYLMPTIFTINNPEQQTLIVGLMALKSSSGAATNWNIMLAGAVVALLPVLVAYTIGNRYFVGGIVEGSVKG